MTQVMQLEITSIKFAYEELGQECVANRIRLQNNLWKLEAISILVEARFCLVEIIIFTEAARRKCWLCYNSSELINGLERFTSWIQVITILVTNKGNIFLTCICNSKTSNSWPLLSIALIGHHGQFRQNCSKKSVEPLEMFRGEKWESVTVYSCIA